MTINEELKTYITTKILPVYETFDKAHSINHIKDVVKDSFLIYADMEQNLNPNMIFTIACYHDIGMLIERKNHPTYSKKILLEDNNLKKFFSEEEISIMGEAVQDHTSVLKNEPRSIYGKIIADADRSKDIEKAVYRALQYAIHYGNGKTKEEIIDESYNYILSKYGENGYLKFWIKSKINNEFLENIKLFLKDKQNFINKTYELINKNLINF